MADPSRREARADRIRDRFGLLLALLVGAFVTLGFSEHAWARFLAVGLQIAAVVVAVAASRVRYDQRWVALLAGAALLALVTAGLSGDIAAGVEAVAVFVLLFALLVAVLNRVLRHRHVTLQTLYGAVCAYFLLGLMFSSIYAAIDSFSTTPFFGRPVAPAVYSYFSFVTLTTLGFGDYTPATDAGRRIVVIEAVAGQVFIATTLARLVSLYRS